MTSQLPIALTFARKATEDHARSALPGSPVRHVNRAGRAAPSASS
jgi:hypothetical protein